MQITPLGFIVIPLGIILFMKGSKSLFWALVISAPFFGTSVLHIASLTTRIQPGFYFAALLILRRSMNAACMKSLNITISRETWLLIFFWIAAGFSLFMPSLLEGQEYIFPVETPVLEFARYGEAIFEPLRLSRVNFTQALYLLFVGSVFIAMRSELKSDKDLIRVLKYLIILAVVAVLVGFFYQLSLATRNTKMFALYHFVMTGSTEFRRIGFFLGPLPLMCSIMGEPGYTGAYLLFNFSILLCLTLVGHSGLLFGTRVSLIILSLLFIGLLFSGTTGLVGLPLLIGALLMFPISHKFHLRRSFLTRILLLVMVLSFLTYFVFKFLLHIPIIDYFYNVHIRKLFLETGSGLVRYSSAMHGLKLFLRHPVLGVGVGSNRTLSMLVTLLSNTGLLGTLPFLLLNWIVFQKGLRTYCHTNSSTLSAITLALLVSFISLFGVMTFAKARMALMYLFYWLLLAMIVTAHDLYKKEAQENEIVSE